MFTQPSNKPVTKQLLLLLLLVLLQITIANARIIVSELSSFSLGQWTLGSGNISANQNICVALLPQGPYTVTASGDVSGGQFVLKSGFDTVPYKLYFNDRPRANGRSELLPGNELIGLRGKRLKRNQPCNSLTANLSIFISESDLTAAPSGRYSSDIVLLVSPQ